MKSRTTSTWRGGEISDGWHNPRCRRISATMTELNSPTNTGQREKGKNRTLCRQFDCSSIYSYHDLHRTAFCFLVLSSQTGTPSLHIVCPANRRSVLTTPSISIPSSIPEKCRIPLQTRTRSVAAIVGIAIVGSRTPLTLSRSATSVLRSLGLHQLPLEARRPHIQQHPAPQTHLMRRRQHPRKLRPVEAAAHPAPSRLLAPNSSSNRQKGNG